MREDKYGPWALIIGGSEGVGRGFAVRLAKQGINIAIVGRRRMFLDEAERAVRAAASNIDLRLLSLDMTAPDMMERLKDFTKDMEVGFLIYNAGSQDRLATFLHDPVEAHLRNIRLNCDGPVHLCHHFGGLMRDRGRGGGIILMGSAAGLAGTLGLSSYAGVKAFDMIFGESLWYEFQQHNISVLTAIISHTRTAGFVRTVGPDVPGADPEEVAEEVLANIENGPTYFSKNTQPQLAFLRDLDRRQVVQTRGDRQTALAGALIDSRRFDPAGPGN